MADRLDATFTGFPACEPAVDRSEIGARGWNALAGDLPLPLPVLKLHATDPAGAPQAAAARAASWEAWGAFQLGMETERAAQTPRSVGIAVGTSRVC